jgi:hypothetical protein
MKDDFDKSLHLQASFFDELCFQVHNKNTFHRNSKETMFPVFSSVARAAYDFERFLFERHDLDQGIRHVSDSWSSETNM